MQHLGIAYLYGLVEKYYLYIIPYEIQLKTKAWLDSYLRQVFDETHVFEIGKNSDLIFCQLKKLIF